MSGNSGTQTTTSRIPARSSISNTNLLDPPGSIMGIREADELALALVTNAPHQSATAMMSAEGSGGDGWEIVAAQAQSPRVILNCTGNEMETHLDKILECPVCFEVILPPILSCVEGHCWCESCHSALQRCPVCRGEILGVRNLLIEQFLEKCRFRCKFHPLGCPVVLPAKDLAVHCRLECSLRPIHCSECNMLVPFDEYLDHLKTRDKIQQHNASECSTGFEIDDNDFYEPPTIGGRRSAVWEPTWLNCYGENFLTFLEYNGSVWWIWVASLTEVGCTYRCQTTLWNKEIKSEITFKGRIHPIRSNAFDVLGSGECLILTASTLRKFVYRRGIDVLVRIEREYDPPRTRRGSEVQSPLIAVRSGTSARTNEQTHAADAEADSRAQNSVSPPRALPRIRGYTPVTPVPRDSGPRPMPNRQVNRNRDEIPPFGNPARPPRQHQSRRMLFTIDPSHRNTRRGLHPQGPFAPRLASVMSSLSGRDVPVVPEEAENSVEVEDLVPAADVEDDGTEDTSQESEQEQDSLD